MKLLSICRYNYSNLNKYVFIIIFIAYASIISLKIFRIESTNSKITPELISSMELTDAGKKEVLNLSLQENLNQMSIDEYSLSEKKYKSKAQKFDNSVIKDTKDYIEQSVNKLEEKNWISNNSILLNHDMAFRGKVIHHYSTVLFPVREIKEGSYSYALTSQYGLISILPILMVKNIGFNYYPIFSLILTICIGAYIMYKTKNSLSKIIIVGSILLAIALCINIGAIRLSPGFSIIRYLPLSLMIYLNIGKESNKYKYILLLIMALLNSLQFNILFFAIIIASNVLIILKNKIINTYQIFSIFTVGLVAIIQVTLYYYQSNAFSPELFSSAGEGSKSLLYSTLIILFPVAVKLCDIYYSYRHDKNIELFNNSEICAYVSYEICASYTIAFYGSPQHYVGFLVMALYPIFIIINKISYSNKFIIISLFIFWFIPIRFHYPTLQTNFVDINSVFYDYKNKLGKNIYFSSPMNIGEISQYYDEITSGLDGKKIYFFSKDKIFIEQYKDKNLYPKIYDAYLNLYNHKTTNYLLKLQNDNVDYVVLDNNFITDKTLLLLNFYKKTISVHEYNSFIDIINSVAKLAYTINDLQVKCNKRYCIYYLK